MSRKLFSLEQFAKFVKARAQLTADYSRSLEKLSQKSPSYLYFEESGVAKMWNQIIHMEAETARVHSNLAQSLQKQVYEQLIYIKEAAEKIRKNVCWSFLFSLFFMVMMDEKRGITCVVWCNRLLWMVRIP